MITKLTGNFYDDPYDKTAFYDFNGRFVGFDGLGLNSEKELFNLVSITRLKDKSFTATVTVPDIKVKGSGIGYMIGAETAIEAFNKALDGIENIT